LRHSKGRPHCAQVRVGFGVPRDFLGGRSGITR
jgi:hypothetical protein